MTTDWTQREHVDEDEWMSAGPGARLQSKSKIKITSKTERGDGQTHGRIVAR